MTAKMGTKQNGHGDSINNLNNSVININSSNEDRIYTYAEAINLAGKFFSFIIQYLN